MKMKKDRSFLNWLWVLLWMGVIFWFSSQTGETSGKNNAFILQLMSKLGWNMQQLFPGMNVNFIIRKIAHVTEYFILALLMARALDNGSRTRKRVLLLAGLYSVLYAASDEFHQVFVPERGPAVRDVLIDSIGIGLGLLITRIRYWMVTDP